WEQEIGSERNSVIEAAFHLELHPRPAVLVLLDAVAAAFHARLPVVLVLLEAELALELAVALPACPIETAVRQRGAHRTAGLADVAAIVEAALREQGFEIGEGGGDASTCLPKPELAHARCVEDQRAVRQEDQLAMRRGVAAGVVVADVA